MFSVEELGQTIADLSVRLDAATHRLLTCIRQFDEGLGWAEQGAVSCAHWLSWRVGLDLATAREKVRVARALGILPAIDEAMCKGKISYAKVRALTRVATPMNEAKLLEVALAATAAQLERLCRGYRNAIATDDSAPAEDRHMRHRLLPGGMVKLEIVLSPDEADLVLRVVDRAREVASDGNDVSAEESPKDDTDPSRPNRVDGLIALAESFLAGSTGSSHGGDRYQVMVHVDQDPLAPDGTMAATLEDGTHLSAETFRRVACDSGIVAAAGSGVTLNIGRRSRSIPTVIRRALNLRDRGCRFPGCTHQRFLHGHHMQHWLHGGETSTQNLVTLCSFHHVFVHEGGWTVKQSEDGEFLFIGPDGNTLAPAPPREVTEDILTWLQEWSEANGINTGPDSNLPLWDGTRPDYDWAVSAMLSPT